MLEQIVSTSRISTYERGSVHDSRAMARLKVRWLGGGERARLPVQSVRVRVSGSNR